MNAQIHGANQDYGLDLGFGYYEYHTRNRTTICRSPNGVISIDIKPRSGESVEIGGEVFHSPKNFSGIKIEIGNFILSNEQTDEEFFNIVKNLDHIVCKCTIQATDLVR